MTSLLQAYQPRWATDFRELRGVLLRQLGELAVDVHHVGSTAVPGMLAKPILDVDIEAAAGVPIAEVSRSLAALGYTYEGEQGIPDRHAYRIDHLEAASSPIRQHVYACPTGSEALRAHLAFRDLLIASEPLRDEYAELKHRCDQLARGDRARYAEAKERLGAGFFARALALR